MRKELEWNDTTGRTREEVLRVLDEMLGVEHTPTTYEK